MEKMSAALSSMGVPAENTTFDGKASEYITYVLTDETPKVYGDDIDQLEVASFYVHVFTPNNPRSLVTKTRRALRKAGFNIENTVYQWERDTRLHHATISAGMEQFTDAENNEGD